MYNIYGIHITHATYIFKYYKYLMVTISDRLSKSNYEIFRLCGIFELFDGFENIQTI